MKTVCIYHSIDLDGWMSAAIVKHWFTRYFDTNILHLEEDGNSIKLITNPSFKHEVQESLTFIGYNYGQPIPDLSEYNKVIMCDISFPAEEMKKLLFYKNGIINKDFIWIDHHISAIKENVWKNTKYPSGLRDTKFAACELTWQYFFPNETMPEIVRLLGRYDCFGHKGTDEEQKVLEFQYGARSVISNYEEAYNYLIDEGMDYKNPEVNTLNIILEKGKSIYQYLCTEAKQTYAKAFPIEFKTYTGKIDTKGSIATSTKYNFICVNQERFNPINFGIDYHKDGYDGCACFWYKDNKWHFSLYNDNGEIDCSAIAKQYGGGGHKGAAGFIIDNLNKVIKNKDIMEEIYEILG
jgi:oligoribonuclease NrnB/cAMP/cGMP phosphodiesterase (DHH superfamily)